MKRSKDDYGRLLAELSADIQDIEQLAISNTRALARISAGSTDPLDHAALGYTMHNLYCVIENYCLRIAKFFENGLDAHSWHKELLERMTLQIAGLRPALLQRDDLLILDDLRSFRHDFRHLYARPLDPDKVMMVQNRVPQALARFRAADRAFQAALQAIRTSL
jgi:hypothetical protein